MGGYRARTLYPGEPPDSYRIEARIANQAGGAFKSGRIVAGERNADARPLAMRFAFQRLEVHRVEGVDPARARKRLRRPRSGTRGVFEGLARDIAVSPLTALLVSSTTLPESDEPAQVGGQTGNNFERNRQHDHVAEFRSVPWASGRCRFSESFDQPLQRVGMT
jgi:hypothetical protein